MAACRGRKWRGCSGVEGKETTTVPSGEGAATHDDVGAAAPRRGGEFGGGAA
jgi:hypothetical protein